MGGMSKLLQLYIGGYGEMITVLQRGGYAQMITILHRGGGSLGTPKSDYVICARPLTLVQVKDLYNSYSGWVVPWCSFFNMSSSLCNILN